MKLQDDDQILESLKDRSRRERRDKRRGKNLVFVNIAIALGIIIVVLAAKAIMTDEPKKQKGDTKKQDKVAEVTATPTAVPTPTAAPASGSDKWIRKDLDPSKPMIAFTFDDGPFTKVTRRILKAMQKSNGRATFFVVGSRIPMYSETLKMAYDQGNQIGSHTYDHKDLSQMKAKKIKWEINKTNKQVSKVIGCNTTALRPPYGNVSKTMHKTIKTPMYYWSVDSEDWKSRNANKVV
ncbi:MAG: polysaccharide deacetylase family protein, partial [Lachnospiraceae bacterium]|nr:polysaccharide deacetylase family protein [Lachnospiraceae bacterium]